MVSYISFAFVEILTLSQLSVINPETLEVEKHCGLDGELHKFCFCRNYKTSKSTFINTEILEFENFCEIYDKFYFVEIITHISWVLSILRLLKLRIFVDFSVDESI